MDTEETAELTPEQKRRRRLRRASLTELAQEFNTDKWGVHYYTPHYERHLSHLKRDEMTLLEIGVGGYARGNQGGGSLRCWKWFFPNAQIVGLDIEDKSFVDHGRVTTVQGSQVDPTVLDSIVERFGAPMIVIDDGSHDPAHVVETFGHLFPQLPDGAIYAIEDIQTSYWPEWGGSEDLDARDTSMAMVKRLIDGLNHEEFVTEGYQPSYTDLNVVGVHCYHNLVFIEKGQNAEGSNKWTVLADRYRDQQP